MINFLSFDAIWETRASKFKELGIDDRTKLSNGNLTNEMKMKMAIFYLFC